MQDRKARKVGPYELDKRLGRGGMGEVFQARSTHLGGLQRSWAIKLMSRRKIGVHFDKIRREAEVGMMLGGHNNIAATLDFGEDPASGLVYIVTEFIDGLDLAQFTDSAEAFGHIVCDHDGGQRYCNVLTLELVVFLVVEIARGLHHAHRITHAKINQKIVHRDLKPRNVMVGLGGEVKIVDYGIASRIGAEPSSYVAGTPAYMAPEQYRGEPATHQADLYSLGVIFLELLTGANPWAGLPENVLHENLLRRKGPPVLVAEQDLAVIAHEGFDARGNPILRPLRADALPREITAVLFGLLGPTPASRIGSALDVVQTLTQWSGYRDMREDLQRAVSFFKQKDAPSTNTTFHPDEVPRVVGRGRLATTKRRPAYGEVATVHLSAPEPPPLLVPSPRFGEAHTTRMPRPIDGSWTHFADPRSVRVDAPTLRFIAAFRHRTTKLPAPDDAGMPAGPANVHERVHVQGGVTTPAVVDTFESVSLRSGVWRLASAYAWMPLVGIALGTAAFFVIVDAIDRARATVPAAAVAPASLATPKPSHTVDPLRVEVPETELVIPRDDPADTAIDATGMPSTTESMIAGEPAAELATATESAIEIWPASAAESTSAPITDATMATTDVTASTESPSPLPASPSPRSRTDQAKRVAESLECIALRTETMATFEFARAFRNTQQRRCWVGHEHERRRQVVRTLFELGRFDDCVHVSQTWHDPRVREIRNICEIRMNQDRNARPSR